MPRLATAEALCVARLPAQDIAEELWGLSSCAYLTTGMSASDKLYLDPQDKARFEPHTRTMVLETHRAIIVAFRGSEPTNLINFRSSGRIALLPQPGAAWSLQSLFPCHCL